MPSMGSRRSSHCSFFWTFCHRKTFTRQSYLTSRARHRHFNSGPWKQKEIPGVVCRCIVKLAALRQDWYTLGNSGKAAEPRWEAKSFSLFPPSLSCSPCQGISAIPFPQVSPCSPASGDAASLGQGLHSRQTWNIRRKKCGRKQQGAAQEKAWFVLHGFSTSLVCLESIGITHTFILYMFFTLALLLKRH